MKYSTYENPFDEFIKVETIIQEAPTSIDLPKNEGINIFFLIAITTFVIAAIITIIYILWESHRIGKNENAPYYIGNYSEDNNHSNNGIPI